jgi:GNAT superfamily N-acetyltransferase
MLTDLIQAAQVAQQDAPAAQARRVERAQADQNRAYVEALARSHPEIGASALALKGGWVLFAGVGSPLTQAMAMGLDGPLSAADLRRVETHLTPSGSTQTSGSGSGGGDTQIELCPYADPALPALLAARGYRVQEFTQVWVRSVRADESTAPEHAAVAAAAPAAKAVETERELPRGVELRRVQAGEETLFARVVLGGFLEQEGEVSPEAALLFEPMPCTEGTECWLAWADGEPAGGGCVSYYDGVATLFGTSVLPRFRRRGIQDALIRCRLSRARAQGCDLASSNTAPGTSSQRNMERAGFRVAYPKVVMLRRHKSRG